MAKSNVPTETPREALERIQSGVSENDARVIAAFAEAGYESVQPRVDVLTYKAWLGAGRQVRKGEKSIRVPIYLHRSREAKDGTVESYCVLTTACLFHREQTDPVSK